MSASAKTGALLVEARTEELPPQLLPDLANQFPDSLLTNLKRAGFADDDSHREQDGDGRPKLLATPRRVAALLKNIRRAAPDRMLTRRGPQVASALDKDGRPTKALEGFLRATGSQFGDLRKLTERGREYFAVDLRETGGTLDAKLAGIVQETLLSLNAPRLMRWGDNDWRFIRPLRGVVMLWERDAIAGEVMGVQGGRTTLGHRFMSEGAVEIASATEYESAMEEARVVADLNARKVSIMEQMVSQLKEGEGPYDDFPEDEPHHFYKNSQVRENGMLLQEVAALCECPSVYRVNMPVGLTDGIPRACLLTCVLEHQKMFLIEQEGRQCFVVADNRPEDETAMLRGFETVLSARLRDLRFYYDADTLAAQKFGWERNYEKLNGIVYHPKLGSEYDRVQRVRRIAEIVGKRLDLADKDKPVIDRAVKICRSALPTLMVQEHPNLTAVMAMEYYAKDAITEEIVTGHDINTSDGVLGPSVSESGARMRVCVSVSFHLERLVGMFSIGEIPTGSKDPLGLRRWAKNLAWTLCQTAATARFPLDDIVRETLSVFGEGAEDVTNAVVDFVAERAVRQYTDETRQWHNFPVLPVAVADAIFSQRPLFYRLADGKARAFCGNTVHKIQTGPLPAANKRINNIFRKSGVDIGKLPPVDEALFQQDEEKTLCREVRRLRKESDAHIAQAENDARTHQNEGKHYREALDILPQIGEAVDAFFDKVMVNADDPKISANRFALLAELRALLNQVADISKLAG